MKLLLEKFNFTINIEENKHTVIVCSEQRGGADLRTEIADSLIPISSNQNAVDRKSVV